MHILDKVRTMENFILKKHKGGEREALMDFVILANERDTDEAIKAALLLVWRFEHKGLISPPVARGLTSSIKK